MEAGPELPDQCIRCNRVYCLLSNGCILSTRSKAKFDQVAN